MSCPAGSYFSLDLEEPDCQECSGNTVSTEGADVCTACNEGYDSVASKTKCGKFCVNNSTLYVHASFNVDYCTLALSYCQLGTTAQGSNYSQIARNCCQIALNCCQLHQ